MPEAIPSVTVQIRDKIFLDQFEDVQEGPNKNILLMLGEKIVLKIT